MMCTKILDLIKSFFDFSHVLIWAGLSVIIANFLAYARFANICLLYVQPAPQRNTRRTFELSQYDNYLETSGESNEWIHEDKLKL